MPPKKNEKNLGKRKKVVLSLNQKVDICNRLETGENRKVLMKIFNIGSSTLSSIKAQKVELLKFLSVSDPGGQRTNLRKGKLKKLEDALIEWYSANLSEGYSISGSMIIERAKYLYKKMKINDSFAFSSGWLSRFKHRHGIRRLDVSCEEKPMFHGPSRTYCDFFSTLVAEHDLSAAQIYSAFETKLLWRSLHDSNSVHERKPIKDSLMSKEESLTALVCANASGIHKLKVFAVGEGELKSPRDNPDLAVVYKSRRDGVMDKELYVQWFEKHFVPSVKLNLRKNGKSEDSKVLLLLDNRTQQLLNCELVSGNIFNVFLPPVVSSSVIPMNQGVIHDLKCNYKIDVMKKICRHEMSVEYFSSRYSIRDAIFYLSGAWESVNSALLKNSWRHLLPCSLIEERRKEENFEECSLR